MDGKYAKNRTFRVLVVDSCSVFRYIFRRFRRKKKNFHSESWMKKKIIFSCWLREKKLHAWLMLSPSWCGRQAWKQKNRDLLDFSYRFLKVRKKRFFFIFWKTRIFFWKFFEKKRNFFIFFDGNFWKFYFFFLKKYFFFLIGSEKSKKRHYFWPINTFIKCTFFDHISVQTSFKRSYLRRPLNWIRNFRDWFFFIFRKQGPRKVDILHTPKTAFWDLLKNEIYFSLSSHQKKKIFDEKYM